MPPSTVSSASFTPRGISVVFDFGAGEAERADAGLVLGAAIAESLIEVLADLLAESLAEVRGEMVAELRRRVLADFPSGAGADLRGRDLGCVDLPPVRASMRVR